jgi:NAD(P)-dependent dehydrogenase (short-subunit alcohol dehydrogenase family)
MRKRNYLLGKLPWLLTLAGGALLLSDMLRRSRTMYFRGASVVITGGSRGLGLEMARIFAREGARLTLLARDREELERARRELIGLGGYVQVHACDIRNREEAERTVGLILNERGRIDVLINNASVIEVGPFENADLSDFEEELDVHVWGPLYLIRAAAPVMKQQGGGRIVNISSIGGVVAIPHLIPYSTAKFAMTGLSDGLRAELAKDGILVTTVVPGLMRTGSHVKAFFKGQHKKEFGWFSVLAGRPLLSISSERAARLIVQAVRHGKPSLVLSGPARILKTMNALFPGLTAAGMKIAGRALPSPGQQEGNRRKSGWESVSVLSPSLLTRFADKAIERNNEQKSRVPEQ